jgi:hypothetical protein
MSKAQVNSKYPHCEMASIWSSKKGDATVQGLPTHTATNEYVMGKCEGAYGFHDPYCKPQLFSLLHHVNVC